MTTDKLTDRTVHKVAQPDGFHNDNIIIIIRIIITSLILKAHGEVYYRTQGRCGKGRAPRARPENCDGPIFYDQRPCTHNSYTRRRQQYFNIISHYTQIHAR